MLLQLLQSASFFDKLLEIDKELSDGLRLERCSSCGGPLHCASYERSAWGAAPLKEDGRRAATRFGLCCGHCRQRALPPSVIFLGRRFYMCGVILVLTMAFQGRKSGHAVKKLQEQVGVSVKTLERWAAYFREDFPRRACWQRVRGRVGVGDRDLPGVLLTLFFEIHGEGEAGLLACLCFLATGRAEVRDE